MSSRGRSNPNENRGLVSDRWRWGNVPVPEPYLVGLVVGIVLQAFVPWPLLPRAWMGHAAGWPLILAGVLLAAWAVLTAGDVDVERPDRIVTGGPYAYSRNPMYVAWAAIYLGITFVLNAAWILLASPGVLALIHVVVRREERALERRFGADYTAYRRQARRYL